MAPSSFAWVPLQVAPAPSPVPAADCFYSLEAEAWVDANGNGTREEGERPLAGVQFQSYGNAAGVSDSNGVARFGGLVPGCYPVDFRLSAVAPRGYRLSTEGSLRVQGLGPLGRRSFGFRAGPSGPSVSSGDQTSGLDSFLGTWRGSSTCTDRVAAPACKDEVVIYDVRPSDKAGVAKLAADKVVDTQRVPMGELEFAYDKGEGCWRSEFETPRAHGVWCLVVKGKEVTGTLRLLPAGSIVRRVQLRRD